MHTEEEAQTQQMQRIYQALNKVNANIDPNDRQPNSSLNYALKQLKQLIEQQRPNYMTKTIKRLILIDVEDAVYELTQHNHVYNMYPHLRPEDKLMALKLLTESMYKMRRLVCPR